MGKAVARGSKQSVASEYIIQNIGLQLHKEVAAMCSDKRNSILHQRPMDSLGTFTWGKLYDEMEVIMHLLLSLLHACTYTHKPRQNRMAVDVYSTTCETSFYKDVSCTKIVSRILYAGHAGKQFS